MSIPGGRFRCAVNSMPNDANGKGEPERDEAKIAQQSLFMRLFDTLVNRVTLQLSTNKVYEQSTIDEEAQRVCPERDVTFDPYISLLDTSTADDNDTIGRQQKSRHVKAELHVGVSNTDPDCQPGANLGSIRQLGDGGRSSDRNNTNNNNKSIRYQRSPVRSDSFLYWVMLAKHPMSILDVRQRDDIEKRVQAFKKDVMLKVGQSSEFLIEAGVDLQERKHVDQKGRSGVSEKRKRCKDAEDILRTLDARDFDRSMSDIVLRYLAITLKLYMKIEHIDGIQCLFPTAIKIYGNEGDEQLHLIFDKQTRRFFSY